MANVYFHPEKFGLEIIYEFDFCETPYHYDLRVVWEDAKTGKRYTGRDTGCSCPIIFEAVESVRDLEEVDPKIIDFRWLDPFKDYFLLGEK